MPKEMIRLTELLGDWRKGTPEIVLIETTGKCLGACSYCYASSTDLSSGHTLTAETIRRLLIEVKEVGIEGIYWSGGGRLAPP